MLIRYHTLSSFERSIIEDHTTERSGSGEYDEYFESGVYLCRRCDAPLYLSQDKFSSHCGWPSFDDEILGAIDRKEDGSRTEIICARCHAHLGHLFTGEMMTMKNIRHCVNSASLQFVSAVTGSGLSHMVIAGGCFWGIEAEIQKLSCVKKTVVGYMGGFVVDPTYEEVSSGETGHVESVDVAYEEGALSKILQSFFKIHDSSLLLPQEGKGSQYQSALFYYIDRQRKVACDAISILQQHNRIVRTRVMPASMFYPAESCHQNYYARH